MNLDNRFLWSSIKVPGAMVRVTRREKETPGTVFRIKNMIDLGNGRKTAILENVSFPEYSLQKERRAKLAIPKEVANLGLVCTSRDVCAVPNVYSAIKKAYAYARLGQIVTDVVAPGDFLVFRQDAGNSGAKLSHALRLVPQG